MVKQTIPNASFERALLIWLDKGKKNIKKTVGEVFSFSQAPPQSCTLHRRQAHEQTQSQRHNWKQKINKIKDKKYM